MVMHFTHNKPNSDELCADPQLIIEVETFGYIRYKCLTCGTPMEISKPQNNV